MSDEAPINRASTPASPLQAAAPQPPKAPRPAGGWRSWVPGAVPLLTIATLALGASNVALWVNLQRAERGPAVAVVGVREMTNRYLSHISNGQITPQELAVRTTLFVSTAQDQVKHASPVPGQLVLARECVLSGEQTDITAEVEQATDARLAADTGGLSNTPGPLASAAVAAQLPGAPGGASPAVTPTALAPVAGALR
jgi:hypothetical protein